MNEYPDNRLREMPMPFKAQESSNRAIRLRCGCPQHLGWTLAWKWN
jgi:hypothetical protein